MSEKIEQVAEAIFMARFRNEPHYNFQDSFEKDEYRREARAAIEAMREPTAGMVSVQYHVEVGDGGMLYLQAEDKRDLWQEMIGEALK